MSAVPRIVVRAAREVAASSPDHLMPWGTRRDNSRNRRFNQKLYRLFPDPGRIVRVLDLGCSGGGFVRDVLDDGHLAVGLEGSDYSKRRGRAEWAVIPDYLFTCDITAPFDVLLDAGDSTEPLRFDVVTAWEVMEHIAEADLPALAENVRRHLAPGGLWIVSISPEPDVVGGVQLHQTVRPRAWWIGWFADHGLAHLDPFERYFASQFVRGRKYGSPDSFPLVLSPDPARAPRVPPRRLADVLYDAWLGSRAQRLLRQAVVGP